MSDLLTQSANLNIRKFNTADASFVFELLNTPNWKQFIGERNINTNEDAVSYIINGPLKSYNTYGYGAWVAALKENNTPIGICGLFKRDYLDCPDLGFAFLPGYEGRGFAFEASIAALTYIKQHYKLASLYATTTNTNSRSQRLLERCGFICTGTVKPPDDEELLLYNLNLQ